MDEYKITEPQIASYELFLRKKDRAAGTIEKYLRDVRSFSGWLGARSVDCDAVIAWRESLQCKGYAAVTINSMLTAVHSFLKFLGWSDCHIKYLKIQRRLFREDELSQDELDALLNQARRAKPDTALLLMTMSATGVRVSEVRFLTVEAVRQRMAVVRLKGKVRALPLGDSLCRTLLAYARERGIRSGPIFLSARGNPLDRRRIWERLKSLCEGAGVDPAKVRPHALRHLFARAFYTMTRDIAKLADILGHSSIETTRIYVATSCREHRQLMERLSRKMGIKKPPRKGGT